ncbi:hypothetical protein M378DRAFT_186759 [Amanita muscaria Koide BX008]|uniref:Uncharacterized protein n=1 Tax=Amanita muscaria (strain Koide BX008) TaxID=946122 RepID=A0A0C2TBZ9_AMAMK|nr:hypothetical protein M378DRAFT_186759 [Amanita muscaria Koide BX008]
MASGSSAIAGLPSLATPPVTQVPALPQPTPTSSKGKRKRKSQDEGEGREEKRIARFKPKCPQNILDRVERVWQQRLFMIDRDRSGDELRETFSVLGSTGNVYTVVIDQMPRCNCPDALKGNHCKHILFIFLKVLRVPNESPHWYQKALLSSELEEIFSQAPLAPNCVAHAHVLDAHVRATAQFSGPSSQSTKKRWPTKDDDCPICYETMFGVAENGLKFCDACGNAIHEECWKQWQASNLRSGKSVTCVWCRAEMNTGGVVKGRKSKGTRTNSDEGYLNLATVAGLSPVRDTSTYRQWGRGYGRDYFDDNY